MGQQLVIWRYISVNVTSEYMHPYLNSFVECFFLLKILLDWRAIIYTVSSLKPSILVVHKSVSKSDFKYGS